jgi:hypothetical protein
MPAPEVLLYPLFVLLFIYVTSMVMMLNRLQAKGEEIDWIWVRMHVIRYIARYKELMIKESGSPGQLYYTFSTSLILIVILIAMLLGGIYQHGWPYSG